MKNSVKVFLVTAALIIASGCHCDKANAGDLGSGSTSAAGFDKLRNYND